MFRTTALLSFVLLAGACTHARTADVAPSSHAYEEALVVDNRASFPVVIRYYRGGGGPFFLDTVGAHQNKRIVLPYPDIGHIFAETEDGRRLGQDQWSTVNPVRISRVAGTTSPRGNLDARPHSSPPAPPL